MRMNQRPIAVALLLCDQFIVDDRTQNITPVNCFSRRVLDGPLTEPQAFGVFLLLTDGLGIMSADLEIVRLDTEESVYRKEIEVRFQSPLQQVRCLLRVRRCIFPVAGPYQATFIVEGECVALRRFLVLHQESSS
jgi:hypothetical protein